MVGYNKQTGEKLRGVDMEPLRIDRVEARRALVASDSFRSMSLLEQNTIVQEVAQDVARVMAIGSQARRQPSVAALNTQWAERRRDNDLMSQFPPGTTLVHALNMQHANHEYAANSEEAVAIRQRGGVPYAYLMGWEIVAGVAPRPFFNSDRQQELDALIAEYGRMIYDVSFRPDDTHRVGRRQAALNVSDSDDDDADDALNERLRRIALNERLRRVAQIRR